MTFKMDAKDLEDPEDEPCKKPNFDSSGGYGARFFMNMMTVKTPSEHTLQGERFDAEITMSLFRWDNSKDKGPVSERWCPSLYINSYTLIEYHLLIVTALHYQRFGQSS